MKRLLLHCMKGLLPLLFIGYIGSISLFTHTHVVNGVTIVHSHPFKSGTSHQHNAAQLQLIHTFTTVLIPDLHIGTPLVIPGFILLCIFLFKKESNNPIRFLHHITLLRAPPAY